jgi:sugar lactone lactonase YvrE
LRVIHRREDDMTFGTAAVQLAVLGGVVCLGVQGCEGKRPSLGSSDTVMQTRTTPPAAPANGFTKVRETRGLDSPESAVYDSAQDVWYVSNIVGDAATKDHRGFISRLKGDGTMDSLHFIQSGNNGAILDAAKGLALHGDTIWVADIDVARAFDKSTGKPLATVDFRPFKALMLNAIAVGPDGHVYITDTAIRMQNGQPQHVGPDRIFVIGAGRKPAVAVQDSAMDGPNGISWDASHKRFLVVGFMGPAITTWTPGDRSVKRLTSGVGRFDGNEVLADGRALISSWADSSLYVLSGDSLTKVIAGSLPTPADLHVNSTTMEVAIPLSSQNEVVFYKVPPS